MLESASVWCEYWKTIFVKLLNINGFRRKLTRPPDAGENIVFLYFTLSEALVTVIGASHAFDIIFFLFKFQCHTF